MVRPVLVARLTMKYINCNILIRYGKLQYPQPFSLGGITTFTVLSTMAFFVKYWNQYFRFYYFVILLLPEKKKRGVLPPQHTSFEKEYKIVSSKCTHCLMWKTKREKQKIADLWFAWYTCYIMWVYLGLRLQSSVMWYHAICYISINITEEPATSIFRSHEVYLINPFRTNLEKQVMITGNINMMVWDVMHIVWLTGTNILEDPAASIFR